MDRKGPDIQEKKDKVKFKENCGGEKKKKITGVEYGRI